MTNNARVREFLNGSLAQEVFKSTKDDIWLSLSVSDSLILEVQPREVLLINKRSRDVVESYASIERALDEDRLFKAVGGKR